ncbi:MAG: tetratricopeptide repeat protein [Planctomycetes bacterium]|nr:tetratricopeptide repeat protein [Planctomycetota bacterium]
MATQSNTPDQAYELAQGFASSGRYLDAISAYSTAIEGGMISPNALIGRGLAFQRIDANDRAVVDFDEVIDSAPDWPGISVAFYGRAVSLHALGRIGEALSDCNELICRDPQNSHAYYLRGTIHKGMKQFDDALHDMDQVIEITPSYWEALFERGKLYLQQQAPEQAIADFTLAMTHQPTVSYVPEILRLRGIAEQTIGNHRAAIQDFTDSIALAPSDGSLYLRRSRSFDEVGERTLAAEDFEKGMRMSRRET